MIFKLKKLLKELNGKPTERTDNIILAVFFICLFILLLQAYFN